jgi:lysophospholipase L1-like esterase
VLVCLVSVLLVLVLGPGRLDGSRPVGTAAAGAADLPAGPAHRDGRIARTYPHGLRVVALGDSVTSGGHCDCDAFPLVYGRMLARQTGVPVHVDNLGVGGLGSAGLLRSLGDAGSPEARAVADADVALVTIGANDFGDHHAEITSGQCTGAPGDDCVADEMAAMRSHVRDILDRARALRHGQSTTVLVTGYWNVFEDGDVARASFPAAGRAATIQLTLRTNAAIRAAAQQAGATYVDLYSPFQDWPGGPTELLAEDGDHPSARGHALTARVLMAAGLPGLPAT